MEFAIQVGGGQVRHDTTGIQAIIDQTVLAESVGFDVVFVPDHYCYEALGQLQVETPAYDMFFVMATLAQRTRRIRIGSHVVCMLFRHPAMTARLFAQIDEASGGRVIAGVGAGWTRAEFTMMGIPFPDVSERLRIMDEAVTVMRGLWGDAPYSFAGNHFQLTDAVCVPKPVQKPGPPLMLGGGGNGILRRAGEWADIIHMVPELGRAGTTTLENLRAFSDDVIDAKLDRVRAAAVRAGRAPDSVRFATTVFTYEMTASPADTQAYAERLGALFGLAPAELLRHPIALIGTPDEMIAELQRRRAAHGLDLVVVNFSTDEQVRQFGDRVLAKLR